MKATGEVMGIGSNLEECMLKSVSSLEIGVTHLHMQKFDSMSTEEIMEYISSFRADGIFAVTELIRRGVDIQTIYEKTWITHLFLESLRKIVDMERELAAHPGDPVQGSPRQKQSGFPALHASTDGVRSICRIVHISM